MAKSSTGTGGGKRGGKGRKLSAETKKKISDQLHAYYETGKTAAERMETKRALKVNYKHPALKSVGSRLNRLPERVRDRLASKLITDHEREKRGARADARREAKMANGKRGSR